MNAVVVVIVAIAGVGIGLAAGYFLPPHGFRPSRNRPRPVSRILLPFTGQEISKRAFEAAVRVARAENATIMPAFLARVPRTLPLDAPLPKACTFGMPLLEAIEQRARSLGVAVDSRISRGRTYRDALQRLLDEESFDRIIVSADANPRNGLTLDDLEWLIERAPAEVLILRPAADDTRSLSVREPVPA
jgi:nucleotide-binding universal stress UspA family protein